MPPPATSTLFPYTTLFRSHECHRTQLVGLQWRCSRRTFDRGGSDRPGRRPAVLPCQLAELPRGGRGIAVDARPARRRAHLRAARSEEHTSELQSPVHLQCRLQLHPPSFPTRRSSDLMNAIALNSSVFNGAAVVGPSIAGVLIALVGVPLCFLANSLSYLGAVAALLLMRDLPDVAPTYEQQDRKSTRLNSSHPSISNAASSYIHPLSLHDALPIS